MGSDEKNNYLKEASVGMAVMDMIPVLLFCGSVLLIGLKWKSPLFLLGGVCSILAGLGKVCWKMILAVTGKSILILNKQFRYLMSGGFFLMLLALFLGRREISSFAVWAAVTALPQAAFFLAGICGMVIMSVLAVKMDHSSKKANWTEQSVNLIAQGCIFLGVLFIFLK